MTELDTLSLLAYLEGKEDFKRTQDLGDPIYIANAVSAILTQISMQNTNQIEALKLVNQTQSAEETKESTKDFVLRAQKKISSLADADLAWKNTDQQLLANANKIKELEQKLAAQIDYTKLISASKDLYGSLGSAKLTKAQQLAYNSLGTELKKH